MNKNKIKCCLQTRECSWINWISTALAGAREWVAPFASVPILDLRQQAVINK